MCVTLTHSLSHCRLFVEERTASKVTRMKASEHTAKQAGWGVRMSDAHQTQGAMRRKPLTQTAKSTTAGIGFLLINRSERTILLSFGQARHQQPYPRVRLAQQLPQQQQPTSI